ncbi:hypothetical protein EUTSA_v10023877mg [Eutrema salsugineum]|uniref:Knottin scorpion toxin-like domain-containing protein n=1 Tax=Eutrema salsugineum TaxID=72664 RepID=V4MCR4_EUTSA|nr:hypothetical protein EUTSA_v10023877mg [Eutrema salsugineum]
MKKAVLIFICVLLFATCTQIRSESCNNDSDCKKIKCLHVWKTKCVKNTCQCVDEGGNVTLPLERKCDSASCAASCKSKGQKIGFYDCALDRCYCRKPLM